MRRLAALVAIATLLALALAACPPRRGDVATPAPVELEWPDAATDVIGSGADAGASRL